MPITCYWTNLLTVLDIIVRKKVIGLLLENLSESNRTAIIASHNLNELENIIDRALLIKGRTIAKDYRLENDAGKCP